MKKVHQAKKVGENRWRRKTFYVPTKTDVIGILVFTFVIGYVVIRSIVG